jgi:hypothetical protein
MVAIAAWVAVPPMPVWFLVIMGKWVMVTQLKISVPPMSIPVVYPTMGTIVVRMMVVTGMVMMRPQIVAALTTVNMGPYRMAMSI